MASDVAVHAAAVTVTRQRTVPLLILLIFILSGAAGLIDEIVWSRQLVLVFGNTIDLMTRKEPWVVLGMMQGLILATEARGQGAPRR